jgi:hypothetical protein
MADSTRVSDPDLRRWYATYRRKYFSNRIPLPSEVEIFYDAIPTLHGEIDDEDMPHNGEFIIRIDKKWENHPDIAKLTLIHEMVHAYLWPYENHGKPFQAEMLRLATLGAFKKLW